MGAREQRVGRGLWRSVRGRLVLMVLIVSLPLLVLEIVNAITSYGARVEREIESTHLRAQAVSTAFENYLQKLWSIQWSVAAALQPEPRDNLPERIAAVLQTQVPQHPTVIAWHWLDPAGQVLASTAPHGAAALQAGDAALAGRLLGGAETVISDLFRTANGDPAFAVARAIRRQGELLGAVAAVVNPRALGSVLPSEPVPGRVYGLSDRNARIVYRNLEPDLAWERRLMTGVGPAILALRGQNPVSTRFRSSVDGITRMGTAVPIAGTDWVAYAVTPVAAVTGPARAGFVKALAVLFVVSAGSLAFAWLFGSALTRNVLALRRAALALSRGDLSARVSGVEDSELGDLARALNEMAGRVQASLSEARTRTAQWQALFDSISDAIVVLDGDSRVLAVNPAGLALAGLGHAPDDIIGRPLQELEQRFSAQHRDGRPLAPEERTESLVSRGEPVDNLALTMINARGEPVDVLISGAPIHYPPDDAPPGAASPHPASPPAAGSAGAGEAGLYMLVVHNVTELRRLERERQRFVQMAAHELRNPLAAVKGLVSVLRRRLTTGRPVPDLVQRLALTEQEIDRLNTLVSEIVDAFRVQSSEGLGLNPEPVDLVALVRETMEPLAVAAHRHRFVLADTGRSAVWVQGDRRRLADVLRNLLANAVKYSPDGGEVQVQVTQQGSWALITVTDHGIGIPPAEREQVFQSFFRGSNRPESDPGGLGLGLFICRDIVRRHGGRIWVKSTPGAGSTFYVQLPLPGTPAAAAADSKPSESASGA